MKKVVRFALSLSLLLSAATLHAQQAPAAAPPILVRASIASFESANKLIADLGLPIPSLKGMAEGWFPFVGPDSLASDRPYGIVVPVVGGVQLANAQDFSQAMVFVMPAADGKLTVDSLMKSGGTAVAGKPDMVSLPAVMLRRTDGNLLMEVGGSGSMALVGDNAFATDYKQPGNVGVVSFDMAAFKAVAPVVYKQFMDGLKNTPMTPGDAANLAGQQIGQSLVVNFIDKLEKVTLAVGVDDKAIHVRSWIASFDAPAGKQLARPVFPQGVIFQNHVIYPNAEWAGWLDRLLDAFPDAAFKLPAEVIGKTRSVFKRMAKLAVGGDGFSIAMGMKNGKPVFYDVNQLGEDLDCAAEMKAIVADFTAVTKASDGTDTMDISAYAAGGKSVTRITLTSGGDKLYFDAIQTGRTISLTVSPDDGKNVEELAAGGMNGTSSELCAGAIDLTAAFAAGTEGGGPLGMLPADALQNIKAAVAGQGITWTMQGADQGKNLITDVQVPLAVAKQFVMLFGHQSQSTPAEGVGRDQGAKP